MVRGKGVVQTETRILKLRPAARYAGDEIWISKRSGTRDEKKTGRGKERANSQVGRKRDRTFSE